MPSSEIITIGTEILLGEIVDTNARYLARSLRDIGVDLYRKTSVGDNVRRIAQAIQQALERCDIVITTGGLGPTVDDPTREAVALAVGVSIEYHPELWEQIQARFERYGRTPTDNNRRQAYIPQGALAVENPVGTAPSFIVETQGKVIIALPGVPREMEYLMQHEIIPFIRQRFNLHGVIKARILHTSGAGESVIDEKVGDLEALSNPTVGLAAHSGQVDVRITAKAESEAAADVMIAEVEAIVRSRLGDWIYGADQETLEEIARARLQQRNWKITIVEAGLNGALLNRFSSHPDQFAGGVLLSSISEADDLAQLTDSIRQKYEAQVGIGTSLVLGTEKHDIQIILITPDGTQSFSRPYGGPAGNAPRYAANHCLDLLRHL
jgi:competence/damage-inducible protein CinA-like protein